MKTLPSGMTSSNRKHIVIWRGTGTNDPGWARILSTAGPVFLVQVGSNTRITTWEHGRQTGQEFKGCLTRWPLIDRMSFGFISSAALMRLTLKHTCGEPVALLIADDSRGLAALWLRRFGKVRAFVSMNGDYLPPVGSWCVRLHRRVNMALNRYIARHADEVWRASPRIPIGQDNPRNFVMQIYVDDNRTPPGDRRAIVYLGEPSPDHDLKTLFDIARRNDIPLHIVGDSPYLRSIMSQAPSNTTFHGYVTDAVQIEAILKECFCGYAVYCDTSPRSYSYYGIPSKSFHYLANNVPVLATNAAHFSQYIASCGVGIVVSGEPDQIENAILKMRSHYLEYHHAITRFREEWNCNLKQLLMERMAFLLAEPAASPGSGFVTYANTGKASSVEWSMESDLMNNATQSYGGACHGVDGSIGFLAPFNGRPASKVVVNQTIKFPVL